MRQQLLPYCGRETENEGDAAAITAVSWPSDGERERCGSNYCRIVTLVQRRRYARHNAHSTNTCSTSPGAGSRPGVTPQPPTSTSPPVNECDVGGGPHRD